MEDHVILVDTEDNAIGTLEKLTAHVEARLHRAISVFVFNSDGDWLLQQRADTKYHSNSLWSNTCCTHPLPGESNADAALRRMSQEMGLQCQLKEVFHFLYKEPLDNNLTEHEIDHVFIGFSDDLPVINPDEVMAFRYVDYSSLIHDLTLNPQRYTVWFRQIVKRVHDAFINRGLITE